MGEFQFEQLEIAYQVVGDAGRPALFWFHSLGASSEMWRQQIGSLSDSFRCIAFDVPGHGQSSDVAGDLSIGDLGQMTLKLAGDLGIDAFNFCGLSLGGMVGQWLGINAPKRLKRLILSNTAAKIADSQLLNQRLEQIDRNGIASVEDSVINGWLTTDFQSERPSDTRSVREMFRKTTDAGYIRVARAVCGFDATAELERITAPTLVTGGRHDRATPPEWNQRIASGIVGAKFMLLDAAHLSNVEAAAEYTDQVRRFLS